MARGKFLLAGAVTLALGACGDKPDTTTAKDMSQGAMQEQDVATLPEMAEPKMADATTSFIVPAYPILPALSAERLASSIETLSADALEGRAPATPGGKRSIEWIEAQMKDIGLKPANGDSYRQAVPLVEVTALPEQSSFVIKSTDGSEVDLTYRKESVYWTKRVVEQVAFEDSEIVFVGYGVVAPEYNWNDYAGVDVTGKTVVMLVNDPGYETQNADLFNGKSMTYYGRWTYKYEEAARQGATAAVIIHQTAPAAYGWGVVEGSWSGPQLDLERPDGGANRVALEGWIQENTARDLFAKAGLDFAQLQKNALKADFTPVTLNGVTASGTITNTVSRDLSANVAGVLEGTSNPDEHVLYMAHWDHLGRSNDDASDTIYNGAVDNATGVAGILEIARSFSAAEKAPERSVIFVAVTAEESGLLGSAYFGEDPLVPLKNIVGGINIDALLPNGPSKDLVVIGYGSSELEDLLKDAADKRGMYLRPDAEPQKGYFYRSDHISLAKKGVPMIYADSGIDLVNGGEEAGLAAGADYTQNRYHKPSDEYNGEWSMDGIVNTLGILRDVGAAMAYSDIDPNWYEGNEFRALRDAQKAE